MSIHSSTGVPCYGVVREANESEAYIEPFDQGDVRFCLRSPLKGACKGWVVSFQQKLVHGNVEDLNAIALRGKNEKVINRVSGTVSRVADLKSFLPGVIQINTDNLQVTDLVESIAREDSEHILNTIKKTLAKGLPVLIQENAVTK